MREILFKGFSTCAGGPDIAYIQNELTHGVWVEGLVFNHQGSGVCIATEPLSANDYGEIYRDCYDQIEPDTLCQFSNKSDKNGVRIFGGDICYDDVRECNVIVSYSEDLMCWILVGSGWDCLLDSGWLEHLSVIGSIHTTPELMGESGSDNTDPLEAGTMKGER